MKGNDTFLRFLRLHFLSFVLWISFRDAHRFKCRTIYLLYKFVTWFGMFDAIGDTAKLREQKLEPEIKKKN